MPASNSKTLSLILQAAARKATTTAKKSTESAPRPTANSSKLAASSILSISEVRVSASSNTPYAGVSHSTPGDRSFANVCIDAFSNKRTSSSNLKLSELVSSHLSPSVSQCAQDEHGEDSDLLRQVSSTINSSSDLPFVKKSDSEEAGNLNAEGDLSSLQMYMTIPDYHTRVSPFNKEVSHERKKKWIYKNTQNIKFKKLILSCAERFGADLTIRVFGRLGRETGLKEYRTLLRLCIESAKKSEDEGALLEQIYKAYELFKSMKEHGFPIDEETYGPFLIFLIEMHLVEEFYFFLGIIKDESSSSNSQIGYYEMLLAIEVNDETKIQELSNQIASCDSERTFTSQEHYLMALCDRDRKKELLEVLERIDITQVSSVENLHHIFSSLGRLSLKFFATRFISELKECDQRPESISILISSYATGMKNVVVDEVISQFRSMHAESGVVPSSLSFEKLIEFCCNSLEVHEALDVANQMFAAGWTASTETINFILHACEESGEFHLVHSIYTMLRRFNWKSNGDTYRSLINLYVRTKDFRGAFSVLEDLQEVNVSPTPNMYNAIIAGFYREKNVKGALEVLERMEAANVKPDSITYMFLIGNSNSEDDITKYYEEVKSSGILITKHISMALINAYANCGKFEEAKQVVLDSGIDVKDINEVKSALVSALASNGRIFDALKIYEDMKMGGCSIEPKSIIALIEYLQPTEKLSTMLQLVNDITDSDYWYDGACRVIGYCVKNKNLRVVVDLLDKVIDKCHDNFIISDSAINEVFSAVADSEPSDVQFGLDLLQAIKDELMLEPTRRCLDFLLSACVTAKDPQSAALIWEEYSTAGLPYNILGFLRMYQVFLASGDQKSAEDILRQIRLDDPHVEHVIRACRATYITSGKKKRSKKKKQHNPM